MEKIGDVRRTINGLRDAEITRQNNEVGTGPRHEAQKRIRELIRQIRDRASGNRELFAGR